MANLLQESQASSSIRYDPKFYIKDLNGAWVDFSARSGTYGTNRLLSVGTIANKIETDLGVLVTTIQKVVLQNNDGFFNKPFSSLLTVAGAASSFAITQGYKRPILKGCVCKVTVQVRFENAYSLNTNDADPRDVVQEEALGMFFIDDVKPDIATRTVELKLISQDGRLTAKEADGIKDGYNWFEYRPVSYLMEEILKSEFAENGELSDSYDIDKTSILETQENTLAISALGRPPLWDGTKFRRDGFYARAVKHANIDGKGKRVYLGCDDELWYYDPATATYTKIGDIASGNNIRFLDVDYDLTESHTGTGSDRGVWFGGHAHSSYEVEILTEPSCTTPVFTGSGTLVMTLYDNGAAFNGPSGEYEVYITDSVSKPNKFKWRKNGGTASSEINVSASLITLEYGLQISFNDIEGGEAEDDKWTWTASSGTCKWRKNVGDGWGDYTTLSSPVGVDNAIDMGWGVTFYYSSVETVDVGDKNTYNVIEDQLVVVAWEDPVFPTYAVASADSFEGWDMDIYTYDGTYFVVRSAGDAIIPGDFLYRNTSANDLGSPQAAYTGYSYGLGGNYDNSIISKTENLCVPFPQHIHSSSYLDTADHNIFYEDDGTSEPLSYVGTSKEGLDIVANGAWHVFLSRGHCMARMYGDKTGEKHIVPLWRVGQRPCMFLSTYKSGYHRYLYWYKWDGDGTSNYYHSQNFYNRPTGIASYDAHFVFQNHTVAGSTTNEFSPLSYIVTSGPTYENKYNQKQPVCMFSVGRYTDKAIIISWRLHGSPGGSSQHPLDPVDTPYKSYSSSWDLTNLTMVSYPLTPTTGEPDELNSDATGDDLYWMPISGQGFDSNVTTDAYGSEDDKVVIVWFNRKILSYSLAIHSSRDFMDEDYTSDAYANGTHLRFSSMPFLGLCYDGTEDCVYAYGMGEGKILKITKAAVLSVLNEISVINESGLLAGLTCDHGHTANIPDIYGITSPTVQVESYHTYPPGKFLMFRLTDSISDIVELADFESLYKWDVIKQLAQSRDGIAFFDRYGNFNYKQRVYSSSTADYSLLADNQYHERILDADLDYGYDKVYNVIQIQAYSTEFEPAESKLTLISRTDNNQNNVDVAQLEFVDHHVEQRDTLKKKVIASCIQAGNPTNGTSKWKYTIVHFEIEALAKGDIADSATTIPVLSVFGGGTYSDAENSEGILVGDLATVSNDTTGEVISRTITTVTESTNQFTIDSAFGIAIKDGTVITILRNFQTSSAYDRANWSDEGIGYISAVGTATFQMSVDLDQPLSPGHLIRVEDDYHDYRITAWDGVNEYTIEQVETGTALWHTTPSVGAVIYAYWSPDRDYPGQIGNTKIYVNFDTGTGTAEEDYTEEFLPGDRLVIDCEGLILKADDRAKQVSVATNSINRHGREEYPIDNRFVNVTIAHELTKRILINYSEPKFLLKLTIPLVPYIDIINTSGELTVIDVTSPEIFPTSQDFKERFLIDSIEHDLKNFTTKLSIRSIESY